MKGRKENTKYDLEDRTLIFAGNVRSLIRKLPKNLTNYEDSKQLTRSSGSIGANYIEANESLGKRDLLMHLRICRKEAKETRYWLKLIETKGDKDLDSSKDRLISEANELLRIFGSIIQKCS